MPSLIKSAGDFANLSVFEDLLKYFKAAAEMDCLQNKKRMDYQKLIHPFFTALFLYCR